MSLLFMFFGVLSIFSGFSVIFVKNSVYSVFFLISTFCLSSCILLLLSVDFLSIIFIVIYVGAIAVLFLFIVMMLNIRVAHTYESVLRFSPLVLILGSIFVSEIFFTLVVSNKEYFLNNFIYFEFLLGDNANLLAFASKVYSYYWPLFVISGVILLLSMLGTISLTLHHSLGVRRQSIYQQVGRSMSSSIYFCKYI